MQEGHGEVDWPRFGYVKIELLRGLAANRSERQIAADAGMAYATVRWHVAQLKALTSCHDVGELARWWRCHAEDWRRWTAALAGPGRARMMEKPYQPYGKTVRLVR